MKEFKNIGALKLVVPDHLQKFFSRNIDDKSTPMILDYGCGYGSWTLFFGQQFNNFHASVYDPDREAEAYTKNLLGEHLVEAANFDYILIFAVLELLPREVQIQVLRKLKSQLKPQGKIIVLYNVYNALSLRWLVFSLLSLGRPTAYHENKKFHRSYLSADNVEQMFTECGFRIRDWETTGLYPKLPQTVNNFFARNVRWKKIYSTIFYCIEPEEN